MCSMKEVTQLWTQRELSPKIPKNGIFGNLWSITLLFGPLSQFSRTPIPDKKDQNKPSVNELHSTKQQPEEVSD